MIKGGAVLIDGNRIMAVGSEEELRIQAPSARFVDAYGGVIMPGLINAHGHIYSAFARGVAIKGYAPKNFSDILDGMWWAIDRHMNLADTEASARAIYVDCIRCGVTTMFDHHASYGQMEGSLFAIADVAREMGIRSCLCYEVSDRDGDAKMRAAVKENVDFIKSAAQDTTGMLRGMMGLHASFTLSDATLDLCRSETPDGSGFHVHVAEGMTDVYDSLKKYSKRVIHRLFDRGILGNRSIAGHCIHVAGDEMDVLKETDTMVVHNPESNMGNAVGCPPTLELMHRGILCGLGTDGYTCDMFESMKVANVLHKHHLCDPTVAWAEVPQMLFAGNPAMTERTFGVTTGVLKAGAAADVIVVAYDPHTPITADNCDGHILFGMMGHDVRTTIANGEILMEDWQLTRVDPVQVMAQCRSQAEDFWKRLNA